MKVETKLVRQTLVPRCFDGRAYGTTCLPASICMLHLTTIGANKKSGDDLPCAQMCLSMHLAWEMVGCASDS